MGLPHPGLSLILGIEGETEIIEGGSGGPPPAGTMGAEPPCLGVQGAEGPRPKTIFSPSQDYEMASPGHVFSFFKHILSPVYGCCMAYSIHVESLFIKLYILSKF